VKNQLGLTNLKNHSMKTNKKVSYEAFMITNGAEGQVFYSPQLDKDLCSLACKLKKKIKTENFISCKVSNKSNGRRKGTIEAIYLTKVTILNELNEEQILKKNKE